MGHCCIRWSFNEEVSQDQRRNTPLGIATSSDGQALIADYYTLKVFDSNGNFYMSVRPSLKLPRTAMMLPFQTFTIRSIY